MAQGPTSPRDTAVSAFVRKLIAEWELSGRELVEIVRLGGLKAKSHPSQVKRGLGVGRVVAPAYARAFGFPDVDALSDAAYDWWKREGRPKASGTHPHVERAIELAVELGQASEPQIRAVIAARGGPEAFDAPSVPEVWSKLGAALVDHRKAEVYEDLRAKEAGEYHAKARKKRAENAEERAKGGRRKRAARAS